MKKCKTCVHKAVCEKSKHIENYRSAGCEHYKDEADVAEVKHGEWVKDIWKIRDDGQIYDYRCSICKGRAHKSEYGNYDVFTKFCHHCGAKMDGE